jgi:predicted RecA/RadA family phage recombinase
MTTPEGKFRTESFVQENTPAAAVSAGEIIKLGDGRAAFYVTDLSASQLGAVYTSCICDVTCATGTTWSAGDPVYWDASASLAVTSQGAADDVYLGTAVKAKASGPLNVRVDLNAVNTGVAARATTTSRFVSVDHSDTTTEYEVISAAENTLGALVHFWGGIVTQAPVGDTEDQMVVTLYDGDDNALATATTTDTTPDAVGDIIVGTLGLYAAATGAVALDVPAGKSAYLKLTQTTDDATPANEAGTINCFVTYGPLA